MSGMFYSLEEAAEKLNKTEDEVRKLVKDGQLREFRDGSSVLFKSDEVDALIQDAEVGEAFETEEPEAPREEMDIPELAGLEDSEQESEEIPDLAEEPAQEEMEIPDPAAEEPSGEAVPAEPVKLEPEIQEIPLESDEFTDSDITRGQDARDTTPAESDAFTDFDMETAVLQSPEESEPAAEEASGTTEEDEDLDSILLAPETGAPAMDGDLTNADTALPGQGTSILGLTDKQEYDLTDDTMADTIVVDGTKGGSTGEGLDEIEEDVSLDSFGSGSGLLDLSLQADDTSLGGILDEIYTDESKEPAAVPDPGTGADMVAESEQIAAPEVSLTPQLGLDAALPVGPAIAQAAPDSQSNILGMLLFIPIAAVLYTAIVALAGLRGILPSILTTIQAWVWPLMGVLGALSLIVAVAAIMLTGEKKAPVAKEKKAKKEKAPKVKKEKVKKPRKQKPPKPDKKAKKAKKAK